MKAGKKVKVRSLCSFLILLLTVAGMTSVSSITALAEETSIAVENPEYLSFWSNSRVVPDLYDCVNEVVKYKWEDFVDNRKTRPTTDEVLAQQYNSVNEGYLTSVKNQGNTTLCWSYTSCAIAETAMIKEYGTGFETDFSEIAFAYFMDTESNLPAEHPLYKDWKKYRSWNGRAYSYQPIGYMLSWRGFWDQSLVSEIDDISDEYNSESEVHLQNVEWYSPEDIVGIKKEIMEKGAVYVSYDGHASALVGWDNDYWLVKNSYGTGEGSQGFTRVLASKVLGVVALDFEPKGNYDSIYQWDGNLAGVSRTGGAANVFTAREDENLRAVGVFVLCNNEVEPDYSYTVKVYRNLPDNSDPLSGELVETVSGIFPGSGYYTLPLGKEVMLKEGEIFSVVVETGCYIGHDSYCYGPGTSFQMTPEGVYEDCYESDIISYNCSII